MRFSVISVAAAVCLIAGVQAAPAAPADPAGTGATAAAPPNPVDAVTSGTGLGGVTKAAGPVAGLAAGLNGPGGPTAGVGKLTTGTGLPAGVPGITKRATRADGPEAQNAPAEGQVRDAQTSTATEGTKPESAGTITKTVKGAEKITQKVDSLTANGKPATDLGSQKFVSPVTHTVDQTSGQVIGSGNQAGLVGSASRVIPQ